MTSLILLRDWRESQIEFWKPIDGLEGYDVSNFGRVRSFRGFKFQGGRWRAVRNQEPRILRGGLDGNGYRQVHIRTNDGRSLMVKPHILAAKAFLPKSSGLLEVNHRNGVKHDPRVDNLEWVTHRQNMLHSYTVGLRDSAATKGVKNCNAKMTEERVAEMRRRSASGEATRKLAREFGVHQKTAMSIIRRETWTHVL